MPQETKIERYEVITVETTQKNQYGDLMVNGKLKVGNKRSHLFDVFQPGAEVKLGYAVYMNKEYIATAEQTGTHISQPPVKPAPYPTEGVPTGDVPKKGTIVPEKGTEEKMTKPDWEKKDAITRASIERQVCLDVAASFVGKSLTAGEDINRDQMISVIRLAELYYKWVSGDLHYEDKELAKMITSFTKGAT